MEEHAGGRLGGDIPPVWLQTQALVQCSVCSRLLAARFGTSCPRCRPALTSPVLSTGRPLLEGCPSLSQISSVQIPLKLHVPTGARLLWGQCVLQALAQVVQFNDLRAWTELFALPKMVLKAQERGGRGNRRRAEAITKRLCRSWLEGDRAPL